MCDPLCCKILCRASLFCTGAGGASKRPRAHEENASTIEQSEAPRQRWKPGLEQFGEPENQDNRAHAESTQGVSLPENHTPHKKPNFRNCRLHYKSGGEFWWPKFMPISFLEDARNADLVLRRVSRLWGAWDKSGAFLFVPCSHNDAVAHALPMGKYTCREVQVYPVECSQQLRRDSSNNGSSNCFLEGTLWDSSLPISLRLWVSPVVCTHPRPLSQYITARNCLKISYVMSWLGLICVRLGLSEERNIFIQKQATIHDS